jgi:hypothetical protein
MNALPENVLEIYDRKILLQDDFQRSLAEYLNHLAVNDFEKLIQILYRVDVDEAKLKYILKKNKEEQAGTLMAKLVTDRQIEKIAVRETFRENQGDWKDC